MPLDLKSLFSGKGRINRTAFWTVQLLLAIFQACLQATGSLFPNMAILAMLLLLLIVGWVVGCFNMAKRLHDLGRSGWWMLLPAAIALIVVSAGVARFGRGSDGAIAAEGPGLLVALVFLLAVGLLKGNPGPNRFGEPPQATPSPAV